MKYTIKHQSTYRLRVHMHIKNMTYEQADILEYYVSNHDEVVRAKVYDKTSDIAIDHNGNVDIIKEILNNFDYESVSIPHEILVNSSRETNSQYIDSIVNKVIFHYGIKFIMPSPIKVALALYKSVPFIKQGLKTFISRKIEVSVLDATAISVSMIRNDFKTASSVMFLLEIGGILEEWTHKKSVADLARAMSLNIKNVWVERNGKRQLISCDDVVEKDLVVVSVGNIIPFDGTVIDGEGYVNQSSLTGESLPVRKAKDATVYAGTVLEDGEIVICVNELVGSSRFEKIVTMIEDNEKLKSGLESKAEHLADKLVPYTFLGTIVTYALTRNITKALSVLMVDFSCALKLAMPVSVLSAIRESGSYGITVKGGKYLEAIEQADTIVFDKTGTLTKAQPKFRKVISFSDYSENELLRIAACLEEHFPHSIASAVVNAAKDKNLAHEEMHSKVEYIVAHGIKSTIDDKPIHIGSYHFIFEDEKCSIPKGYEEVFSQLDDDCSLLYLSMNNTLVGVLCIEDPLRDEAKDIIASLKALGINKVVMMTGDSEKTALAIAKKVGVDEYYSEVLPEDKANFIEKEKANGRKVIMVGDGINDSPALSAANVGIAINSGAEIAKEIADITINGEDLYQLVLLKELSNELMRRIKSNYYKIVSINSMLILLGVTGFIQPTTSAMLHNGSTLTIGLSSTKALIEQS